MQLAKLLPQVEMRQSELLGFWNTQALTVGGTLHGAKNNVAVQTLSTSARNNRWILYPSFRSVTREVYFESAAIGSRQHLYTCRHGWLSPTQLLQQWQQELKVRT